MREANSLPFWDETPADVADATRTIKAAIRDDMARRDRPIEAVIADFETYLHAEIADIETTRASGKEAWPVIDFDDIAAGRVSDEQRAYLRRRGCVVVRGNFGRSTAEAWDRDIVENTSRATSFSRTTESPPTTSSTPSNRSRKSMVCTGRGPRWRRASTRRWQRHAAS